MSYRDQQTRVTAAEHVFDAAYTAALTDWQGLRTSTRAVFTPWHTLAAGFIGGFTLGLTAPLRRLRGKMRLLRTAVGWASVIGAFLAQRHDPPGDTGASAPHLQGNGRRNPCRGARPTRFFSRIKSR